MKFNNLKRMDMFTFDKSDFYVMIDPPKVDEGPASIIAIEPYDDGSGPPDANKINIKSYGNFFGVSEDAFVIAPMKQLFDQIFSGYEYDI